MATRSGGRRNISRAGVLAMLWMSAAACDPCAGTGACADPYLSAQGRVIWHLSGEFAEGVRVEFRPASGGDSIAPATAVSGENGVFTFDMPASGAAPVSGDLVFFPPAPFEGFVFNAGRVTIAPIRVRADVRALGLYGVGPLPGPPHISYVGELRYADSGERAAGVEVEFRRTGGIPVRPDTTIVRTDQFGRFPLFLEPVPRQDGEVTGTILVRPRAPYEAFTIPEVRMPTRRGVNDIRLLGVWEIPLAG